MTPRFLEQIQFGSDDPEASCRENEADPSGVAESVDVSNIRIDGDSALAEAAYEGGSVGGQTLELRVVKDDGEWKLDRIESFLAFDRESLLGQVAKSAEDDPELTPAMRRCFATFKGVSDEELQRALLSGDRSGFLALLLGSCPDAYRAAIIAEFENEPRIDPRVKECIVSALEQVSDARLAEFTLADTGEALQEFLAERCSPAAGSATT
jgi:hypothetical protein